MYSFNKELPGTVEDVAERVTQALAKEGFGVLTKIDVKETMKKKIDKDIAPYLILGACNPNFAYQALQSEPHIGTMLPCNVIIREVRPGLSEVAAVDPVASMAAVQNEKLANIAGSVRGALQRVVSGL